MSEREQWTCPRCGLIGDAGRSLDPERCLHCCRIDVADSLYLLLQEAFDDYRSRMPAGWVNEVLRVLIEARGGGAARDPGGDR